MDISTLAPLVAAWAKMQATAAGNTGGIKDSFNNLFYLVLLAELEEGQSPAVEATGTGRKPATAAHNPRSGARSLPEPGFKDLISRVAARYNLPAALLQGVVEAESGFNPRAVSPAGAMGLMQLMPATARALGVTDPFNPEANLDGGARYLRQLLDRFQGDLALALAAYNAGPGAVKRYGHIPPYRETRAYIQKVLAAARRFEGLA
ncbi:Prokaryotic transglycosylase, active site [Moorella glycerini]|uniref:Soluble lytic murein transglycosylase n=1 Tax=Neomoorella stamsii TaxID=1266720 RepID=A0A9X7J3Z7_9FIRM|nr:MULTISPECIES: lytic transglycosylase domain-containing protein [Moorella]PRR75344.1 Soluble lytic murein transglycosylase precursor [Moorella stamsii]CEP67318.1 Prokaryotic transglycosylase, active site [Moorella glycerini]